MMSRHYTTVERPKRERFGPVAQKILLLLTAGLSLSLSGRPDRYFRILKSAKKEWQKINRRSLMEAIRRLYQSKMINYKENNDGTVSLVLEENGRKRILRYNLDKIELRKQDRWDGLWRLVLFDIPESRKKARDALTVKLKHLGFFPLQKSVFVYPYKCKEEIEFIVEIFELKPYVRFITAREMDIALDLKHRFRLID